MRPGPCKSQATPVHEEYIVKKDSLLQGILQTRYSLVDVLETKGHLDVEKRPISMLDSVVIGMRVGYSNYHHDVSSSSRYGQVSAFMDVVKLPQGIITTT
jgi:hypothetical protein